jgi:hypothetical protein
MPGTKLVQPVTKMPIMACITRRSEVVSNTALHAGGPVSSLDIKTGYTDRV